MRTKINLSLQLSSKEVEVYVLGLEEIQKWMENKSPKKVIVVPGKIVNIVL
jgi:leucyl-tRNA synthetase